MADATEIGALALFALGYACFVEGVRLWWRAREADNVTGTAASAVGPARTSS
jgi:hypothetical protein